MVSVWEELWLQPKAQAQLFHPTLEEGGPSPADRAVWANNGKKWKNSAVVFPMEEEVSTAGLVLTWNGRESESALTV